MGGSVVTAATGLAGLVGGLVIGSKALGGSKSKRYVHVLVTHTNEPTVSSVRTSSLWYIFRYPFVVSFLTPSSVPGTYCFFLFFFLFLLCG